MGFISTIFGRRESKRPIPAEKGYKGSAMGAFVDGALTNVKLTSMLLGIMGKWLVLFSREKILDEAIVELDEKELRCLADFFPEFLGKGG